MQVKFNRLDDLKRMLLKTGAQKESSTYLNT